MKKSMFLALLICCSKFILADSPVTSTNFHTAYQDIPMVVYAGEKGIIDQEIADFLMNPEHEIDLKAAVINALSWDFNGKSNALRYRDFLKEKHNKRYLKKIHKMEAHDLFCLGYLTAMDDYFNCYPALEFLEEAVKKQPGSFTMQIILAIVKAQIAFDVNWCEVWKLTDEVLKKDDLERDMRENAIEIIVNYMILYKESCK